MLVRATTLQGLLVLHVQTNCTCLDHSKVLLARVPINGSCLACMAAHTCVVTTAVAAGSTIDAPLPAAVPITRAAACRRVSLQTISRVALQRAWATGSLYTQNARIMI